MRKMRAFPPTPCRSASPWDLSELAPLQGSPSPTSLTNPSPRAAWKTALVTELSSHAGGLTSTYGAQGPCAQDTVVGAPRAGGLESDGPDCGLGKERRSGEGLENRGTGGRSREVGIGKCVVTKHLLGVRQ